MVPSIAYFHELCNTSSTQSLHDISTTTHNEEAEGRPLLVWVSTKGLLSVVIIYISPRWD